MMEKVIEVAIEAGKEILKVYEKTFSIDYKEDKTPVTEADRISHSIIKERLKEIDKSIPILSEEGKDIPYEKRKSWKRFWLVDPLDGTKEFINKREDFTVNIALVEDRKPLIGVVYAPAKNLLYFAERGKGAYSMKVENGFDIKKAQRLPLKDNYADKNTIRVVASRSHMNEDTKKFIEKLKSSGVDVKTLSIGSSLKICLVAEGKADIYPRIGPTMEWDTAAAHIVAEESNCVVKEYKTAKELLYNKENLKNDPFVVFREELEDYVFDN